MDATPSMTRESIGSQIRSMFMLSGSTSARHAWLNYPRSAYSLSLDHQYIRRCEAVNAPGAGTSAAAAAADADANEEQEVEQEADDDF